MKSSSRQTQPRLDVRAPLVLDTRELGRRPGSMRRVSFVAPAPEDLGTPLIGVPSGAPIELDLRLEAVMEGVLVSGVATMVLVGECGRCLDAVSQRHEVDLQELYAYPGAGESDPDDELPTLVDDHLDLEPALRDAIVLDLPAAPLCRDDCPGLCSECGARLEDVGEDHRHDSTDPRWAALSRLLPPSAESGTDLGVDRSTDLNIEQKES